MSEQPKESETSREETAVGAFLAAMKDGGLDSGAVRKAMEKVLGSTAEERAIRRLLCVRVAGSAAYMDDGEAHDNSKRPSIDFLRDSAADIQRKLFERGLATLAAAPPTTKPEPLDDVFKVTAKNGETCHFGTEGSARIWGGTGCKVERVKLRNLAMVEPPEAAPALAGGAILPLDKDAPLYSRNEMDKFARSISASAKKFGLILMVHMDGTARLETLTPGTAHLAAHPVPVAGERVREWLDQDQAENALFEAIQAITLGNKTDDKLILAKLKERGVWLARYSVDKTADLQRQSVDKIANLQGLPEKATVQRVMDLARRFRAAHSEDYDAAYKELESFAYAALASREQATSRAQGEPSDSAMLDWLIANEQQVWEVNGRYSVRDVTEGHAVTGTFWAARDAIRASMLAARPAASAADAGREP